MRRGGKRSCLKRCSRPSAVVSLSGDYSGMIFVKLRPARYSAGKIRGRRRWRSYRHTHGGRSLSGRKEEKVGRHGGRSIFLEGGSTHKGDGSLMQVEREGGDINHKTITKNTQGLETTNPDDLNTRIIQVKSQPFFIDNDALL